MPRLSPFRHVEEFVVCWDLTDGTRRRIIRMKLECGHMILRYDETETERKLVPCRDCRNKLRPKGRSKAALAKWGL